jgi:hypothetical protein
MDTTLTKKLLGVQSLVLLCGTVYAWSKLIPQFTHFYALYGTFLRFSNCTIPNPFATACLYGSTAFLVALFWSIRMYQAPQYTGERRLRNFLAFCVAFAASVVLYEAAEYYKLFTSTVSFSCTPGASPLQTPCFYGMLFFIIAFITSIVATRRLKSTLVAAI